MSNQEMTIRKGILLILCLIAIYGSICIVVYGAMGFLT